MLLDKFPIEPQTNLSPGISLKSFLLANSGNKNKRIRQNDSKSVDDSEVSKTHWLAQEILNKKTGDHKLIINSWAEDDAVRSYSWGPNVDKTTTLIFKFPFDEAKTYQQYEELSENTDFDNFFNPKELSLEKTKEQTKLDHLKKSFISMTTISRLLPNQWLMEESINVNLSYLFRNHEATKTFCLWPSSVYHNYLKLKRSESEAERQAILQKKKNDVIRKCYFSIVGRNKVGNIFSYYYWVIPIHTKNHWSLMIIVRPKFLFSKPPTREKECLVLFCDSINKKLHDLISKEDMDLFNKFLIEIQKLEDDKLNFPDEQQFSKLTTKSINCYEQNNSYDCGIYVCVYAREFIISILRDKVTYSYKNLKNCESCFKGKYDFYRIQEIRKASFLLVSNMMKHNAKNNKISCNTKILRILGSHFLDANDIKQITENQAAFETFCQKTGKGKQLGFLQQRFLELKHSSKKSSNIL